MLVDHSTIPYNATVSGLAAGYRVEVADGTAEVRARLCPLVWTAGLKGLINGMYINESRAEPAWKGLTYRIKVTTARR